MQLTTHRSPLRQRVTRSTARRASAFHLHEICGHEAIARVSHRGVERVAQSPEYRDIPGQQRDGVHRLVDRDHQPIARLTRHGDGARRRYAEFPGRHAQGVCAGHGLLACRSGALPSCGLARGADLTEDLQRNAIDDLAGGAINEQEVRVADVHAPHDALLLSGVVERRRTVLS